MSFFKVLRTPHLALLWSGQMLSALGDQLFSVAIIWTATRLLGSSAGRVLALGSLAALFTGLPGGVLADRWPRHATMIGADLVRALAVGTLALLAVNGNLQPWYLILIIMVLDALGTPACYCLLPTDRQLTQQDLIAAVGML